MARVIGIIMVCAGVLMLVGGLVRPAGSSSLIDLCGVVCLR